MLYIFDSTEKLITTLPKGSFFDAVHYEVLNGENTFEFTLPAGSEYVVEGNLVAFRDLDSYWQIFEIKRLVDTHGDGLTRTAYCEHIFYELLDDIVVDKRPSAGALAALDGMLEGTRWQTGIVDDLGASSASAYYISGLEAVQKVANAWRGELNWRCVIAGGIITRYVDLKAMVGTDTGKQFAYSKDILSIEREVDLSGVYTALYGRGKGVELESGSYGRRLTFAGIEGYGKPLGQEWVGDSDALAQWGRPGGRHRFGVFTDEEETDPNVLLQKTWDYLQTVNTPRVTYRLNVVALEELSGYEHEKARKGDLVRVIDREFTPELVVSARVIDIERDLLDPANTKVVLGSFAPTIVEATINTQRRVDEMANRPFNTKWLDGKISVLQNAIENVQSYVFQTADDGILILDAADYATATQAMKLGGGIFAIANQKDGQGGWNWRTFGDGAGFTADLITAGIIDAGMVQVGPETTFAPGYDPTLIDPSASATMGVDSDCLGLWHFDGSLNSHKGVAADSDGAFGDGCFGQALNIATGKHLKVSTNGMSASAGTVNFRAKNLSASPNASVLVDVPDNVGNQGMLCGIADDGNLFIEDAKLQFLETETSQADFNTGTLSDVQATSAGNLELARDGQDFTYTETSQADFQSGTLTDVTATSVGDLELVGVATEYGSDFTGGKTYSADSEFSAEFLAGKAFDNDESAGWASAATAFPHWVKVDLGSGVSKVARKLRIKAYDSPYNGLKDFKLQGSNDNINWSNVYAGTASETTAWQEFTFNNAITYRYYRVYVTSNYRSDTVGAVVEIELMEGTTTYKSPGTRIKEVDISGANPADGTKIEWSKTTPANTTVKVETALSTDGGSTYGAYAEATSGGSIPDITAQTDLTNARLKIKETLSTTDTSVTPRLHSLSVYIYTPYKSSGYRYKEYNISAVGSVGSSKILWTENNPANTTLTVKTAVSTDGGTTYGSFQNCTSGSAIPGLTQGMDISNARLKVQEDLATSDGTVTPQLQELTIYVGSNVQTVYGPNKSTLTEWNSISLAWKPDRLSLVVNDEEACYIENPGLPTAFDSYIFIGADRNGANAINTLVDELRIDKVYREVNIRTGWHKAGVPFYTSEDMKQWPGNTKVETEGLKVYDALGNLRVLIGSWLKDAVRKYGIKIVDGEIYSSLIRTGTENATRYIAFEPPNELAVYAQKSASEAVPYEVMRFLTPPYADAGASGVEWSYEDATFGKELYAWINAAPDSKALTIYSKYGQLMLAATDGVYCSGDFRVVGGTKHNIEHTENYGIRGLAVRESPEQKYIDEGFGTLEDGICRIDIDPIFMECIEPHTELSPWHIQLTPYADVAVYVAEIGESYFVVKEKDGGTNMGAKFTWSLSATRKNYAGIRLMEVVE